MGKLVKKIFSYILNVLLLVVVGGCTGVGLPHVRQMAPLPPHSLCKIAVLPFINDTNFVDGDIIPYRVFMSELNRSDSFHLSQEGDIRSLYREMSIFPGQSPDYDQIRVLSDRLNVDLLISGSIVEMVEDRSGRGKPPLLSVNLSIIDGKTGMILWTTYHRRAGAEYRKIMHFGLVNTITSLSQKMSREIIASWFEEGLKVCNNS